MYGAGCGMQDAGYRMQDAGCKMQDADPMCAFSVTRSPGSVFGARCWVLGVGPGQVPGTRSQVPDSRYPIPGTRDRINAEDRACPLESAHRVYILHPASCILHRASCIPHLASCILHPISFTCMRSRS